MKRTTRRRVLVGIGCSILLAWGGCRRDDQDSVVDEGEEPLHVAVASNFAVPMKQLQQRFEIEYGAKLVVSTGSTGKLAAQIRNGAPYHVFLAADEARPVQLEREGKAQPGSRFVYAYGRLALYGQGLRDSSEGARNLESGRIEHFAIANPDTAPYGRAAREVLQKLGLWSELESKIVQGENIAQTFQFVNTQGAELGLVALSSVVELPSEQYWLVPEHLHAPIRQDAIALLSASEHPLTDDFLRFLKGPVARDVIERAGYRVP